ncbi:hypothetical protein [Nocardioides massiliensis]|uniref:Phage protein n=1 Tax=Nocardioides massiliensis TaxID=1325935 RepID=A0ABT9NKY8_9ACTN|nr:hypothetical protein [Nocardioides massiliensis]MDP9820505.1 hypothetical protein [Nocardioides massiliensis]
MSEKYTPVEGDKVRVVLEGAVDCTVSLGFFVDADDVRSFVANKHVVSVEKIKPPVEVFGPGDTVRSKACRQLYSIGWGGYFVHATGKWRRELHLPFTSERYERVELK